jgi:hypothetical protein
MNVEKQNDMNLETRNPKVERVVSNALAWARAIGLGTSRSTFLLS